MNNEVKKYEIGHMEKFYEKVARYDALIIEADDIIEQDMSNGAIKIDNSVFDDFIENSVIYIYCADINANVVMEFAMKEQDDDGIIMKWLDCFSV